MPAIATLVVALASSGCATLYDQPVTPIARAAWRGDIDAVRALVQSGVNINEEDASGSTPLFLAARGGHPLGPHRCGQETAARSAFVAAMLDMGASPNARDHRPRTLGGSSGWTPLFVALHHNQFKSAQILIERGADVNIRSDQGMSALDMARVQRAPQPLLDLIRSRVTRP